MSFTLPAPACIPATQTATLTATQTDSLLSTQLEQVDIDDVHTGMVTGHMAGRMDIDAATIERSGRVLGFADPLRYVQSLPGVQTTAELQGGLFVDGTGSSHTLVTLDGAPVYNPSHLLGIFSMFNTLHLGEMSFSGRAAGTSGRLGGLLEMKSDTVLPGSIHFKADAGILGSAAGLKIPVTGNSMLSLSGRVIYFNLMSHHYLRPFWQGNDIDYGFSDVNATWTTRFSGGDVFKASFFQGSDNAGLYAQNDILGLEMNWRNTVLSTMWSHMTLYGRIEQTLYGTAYCCRFNVGLSSKNLYLPGGIADVSYKLDGYRTIAGGMLKYGLRLSHYDFEEQTPQITYTPHKSYSFRRDMTAADASVSITLDWNLTGDNVFELSLAGNAFKRSNEGPVASIDPGASVTHTFGDGWGVLGLKAGMAHQYLHLCGFTTNGMPLEFWLPTGAGVRPESLVLTQLDYERDLFDGYVNFQLQVYAKLLRGTIEFNSNFLKALDEDYSLWDNILQGDGYAYGGKLMLGSTRGLVDWMASYTFGHSRLKLDGSSGYVPCFYERPHDFKLRVGWNMNDRWRFGADALACSGTPFTMPRCVYVMNETVVLEYGQHNNARMPAMWRVDLNAGWTLKHTDRLNCGIDFSLYNALMAKNVMYYYYNKSENSDDYMMKRFMPMPVCLPSAVFHMEF